MALEFLRRDAREARIVPTQAELELRIDALKLELARAHKRIDALERAQSGKLPTLEDCDSARKLMAHIGRTALGGTGDTAHLPVRTALSKHANFAQLREALTRRYATNPSGTMSIVADEKILRWLAEPSRVAPARIRFDLIHSGAYTARALAEAER